MHQRLKIVLLPLAHLLAAIPPDASSSHSSSHDLNCQPSDHSSSPRPALPAQLPLSSSLAPPTGPMLLNKSLFLRAMQEGDTDLVKSTESGDTNLVYLVLFHIWQKKPSLDFFGSINGRALARDLFITYARFYKHEFVKDCFLSMGQLQDESWDFEKNPMDSKGFPLQGSRIRLIEQAQKFFSETKERHFKSKASQEHAKLLRLQHEFEVSTKQAIFVCSSISDTIRTGIVLGNHRAALRVRT